MYKECIKAKKEKHKGYVNYHITNGYNQAIENIVKALSDIKNK